MLDLCDSLKAKAICGVLLSLVGNAGTLITYTIGKDTLTQLFRLNFNIIQTTVIINGALLYWGFPTVIQGLLYRDVSEGQPVRPGLHLNFQIP